MLVSIRILAAFELIAVAISQQLPKPAAWPDFSHINPALGTLPRTTTVISRWVSGNISKGCRDRVVLDGRDPTQFDSYTIFMGDCEQPWYVCKERGAEPSLDTLIDTFARVPIGMRQFVGDVVHFKGGGGASAWHTGIVHVSGMTANSVSVFLHEASHCVDGANGMGIRSGDQTWRDAYDLDTHVADEYARSSHVENFAQYAGLIIYDRFTNRNLQTWVRQYYSVVQQIRRMAAAADSVQPWGDKMFDYSGTKRCGRRWALTPAVDPRTGTLIGKRDMHYSPRRNTGILVVPVEFADDTPTNCTVGPGNTV